MTERSASSGFTLIEVLVALGVFSMAAMGLAHLTTETTRSARYVDLRVLAKIEADNQIVNAVLREKGLRPDVSSGSALQRGQTLAWTRTIVPAGRENLLAVSISVTHPETGQELARRQTLLSVNR